MGQADFLLDERSIYSEVCFLRWIPYGYNDLPKTGEKTGLPDLLSGSSGKYQTKLLTGEIRRVVVDVIRPTGFSALTVEYLDEAAQR